MLEKAKEIADKKQEETAYRQLLKVIKFIKVLFHKGNHVKMSFLCAVGILEFDYTTQFREWVFWACGFTCGIDVQPNGIMVLYKREKHEYSAP